MIALFQWCSVDECRCLGSASDHHEQTREKPRGIFPLTLEMKLEHSFRFKGNGNLDTDLCRQPGFRRSGLQEAFQPTSNHW